MIIFNKLIYFGEKKRGRFLYNVLIYFKVFHPTYLIKETINFEHILRFFNIILSLDRCSN